MKRYALISSMVLAMVCVLPLCSFAADPVVTVLDTTVAENGPSQAVSYSFIKNDDYPLIISCDVGAADVVDFQVKPASADSWVSVYQWTAGTDEVKSFRPLRYWRMIRSTDGTSADTTCKAVNLYNAEMTAHE